MTISEKIVKLYRQLFPTGRAFRMYTDGNNERLHRVLATTNAKVYKDIISTLDSILADNKNFTTSDCDDWERRLGITASPMASIDDRKSAIRRKMSAPGVNPARSAALWLEYQLRLAGFNVYVHENIIPLYPTGYERVAPEVYSNNILTDLEHGVFEHGQMQTGSYYNYIVANSVTNSEDIAQFNNITDFGCSFFIGGINFGDYANVPAIREKEFRALLIGQKQCQMIAFCYLNFY